MILNIWGVLMPFSPWPSFTGAEEADAVRDVLYVQQSQLLDGHRRGRCREFEKEFAAWAGASHAVAWPMARWRWMWL
jgi:dTDP-4-amino-4,6-dideoxygalactose transaminase